MTVKLNKEDLGSIQNAPISFFNKAKSIGLAAMLTASLLGNVEKVEAAQTIPPAQTMEENIEFENIKYTATQLQGGFSLIQQENIVNAGVHMIGADNLKGKTIQHVFDEVDENYEKLMRNSRVNPRDYSMADYAQDYSSKYKLSIDDVPVNISQYIQSYLEHPTELTGVKRDAVIINGLEIAKQKNIDVVYQEDAIEISQRSFANNVYKQGGVWSNEENNVTMEFSALQESYNDFIKTTYSKDMLELARKIPLLNKDNKSGYQQTQIRYTNKMDIAGIDVKDADRKMNELREYFENETNDNSKVTLIIEKENNTKYANVSKLGK